MTIAIIASVMAGMAVGFHFKIFMVVPYILVAATTTVTIAAMQGETFSAIALTTCLSAAALQVGYLCASFAISLKEVGSRAPAEAYSTAATVSIQSSDR